MRDYKNMPAKIPVLIANDDSGHAGTYMKPQGGSYGKIATAFFQWQLKGDKSKEVDFLNPAKTSFAKAGWKIESKNWNLVPKRF